MADNQNSDVMNQVSRTLLDRVDDKTVSFCARWFWIGITMLILGIDFDGPVNALTSGLVNQLFAPEPAVVTIAPPVGTAALPPGTATLDDLRPVLEMLEPIEQRLQHLESMAHAPGPSQSVDH